jgi:hypothetical protein
MKRLFVRTALLATLFTGCSTSGDQALSIDRTSSDSVNAIALEWFEHLQAGQIDRTQMTTAFSEHLTDDAVQDMSRFLVTYGPASGGEVVKSRTIQDQTFYVVKLLLERGDALSLLIGFAENGKITGITFTSMGQE